MTSHSAQDLAKIYQARFQGQSKYRHEVWNVLCGYFSQWIPPKAVVLDLGCGYCEFINTVMADRKYAMDLNPDVASLAAKDVQVIQQDCSAPWAIGPGSLDCVFTSNFFEHLPDKAALERTLENAQIALRPGGKLLMMGPNIKYVPGAYWDFFDHYVPLTELSLAEILIKIGYQIDVSYGRFLPYSMSQGRTYPIWMLRVYLALPQIWRFFGKQFFVVARKAAVT